MLGVYNLGKGVMVLNELSLFSGYGGFSLGLQLAGLNRRRRIMADTQWEDLRDIAARSAGMRYDSAEAQAIHGSGDWTQYYPEVDGYGFLTGRVIDGDDDGYLVVDDVAMVWAEAK